MILAVDVGNTNIVFGCIENGEILNIVRIHTDDRSTDVEYAIKLKQILEVQNIDVRGFEGVIISSVVPTVTQALSRAVRILTGQKAMVVGPGIRTGMNVRIDDPSTLAGDLVVGSVAAMNYYGTPCIIIDMGTATTIVYVDGEALDEPYTFSPTNLDEGVSFPLVVEENCFFVMGDNRNNSLDSRSTTVGFIDTRYLLGTAEFRLFPIGHWKIGA